MLNTIADECMTRLLDQAKISVVSVLFSMAIDELIELSQCTGVEETEQFRVLRSAETFDGLLNISAGISG